MMQYRNQGIAEVSIAPPVKAFISQGAGMSCLTFLKNGIIILLAIASVSSQR